MSNLELQPKDKSEQNKIVKGRLQTVFLVLLALLSVGFATLTYNYHNNYIQASSEVESLENDKNDLIASNESLQNEIESLQSDNKLQKDSISSYENQLTELQSEYESIQEHEEAYQSLNTQYISLKKKYSSLNTKYKTLKSENTVLESEKLNLKEEIEGYKNSSTTSSNNSTYYDDDDSDSGSSYTVYITRTGSKYHSSGCRYLSRSKISISKSSAISQGYSACSVCNP
jgi:DNA repair exonuclease SbcCD ATPase subunit